MFGILHISLFAAYVKSAIDSSGRNDDLPLQKPLDVQMCDMKEDQFGVGATSDTGNATYNHNQKTHVKSTTMMSHMI